MILILMDLSSQINQKYLRYIINQAVVFNQFIQENLDKNLADKDAKDFIKATALCNQQRVNIDEWLFSFSKLYVVDPTAFKQFIEDYQNIVRAKKKNIRQYTQELLMQ